MRIGFSGVPIWVGQIMTVLAAGAAWQFCFWAGWTNPILVGDPIGILRFLFDGLFVNRILLPHLLWTIMGTGSAFLLGSGAGIGVGLLFVTYPTAERFMEPILAGFNALPRIALAPLFLLWFGLGIASKIALGTSLTFFIVLSSTIAGARGVNGDHLILARTLGAGPSQVFYRITLPSAVPTVFSGLRLGLIYALLGVVAGEIIAAQKGLGQMLSFYAGVFQTNGVFAVLLLLALLGMGVIHLMNAIEARLLRWK